MSKIYQAYTTLSAFGRRPTKSKPSAVLSKSGDAILQRVPWTRMGDAEEHLLMELEKLYWLGIQQELESLLVTLRAWQRPDLCDISVEDDSDDFVHGFDTFIDQVSDQGREFAKRVEELKDSIGVSSGWKYKRTLAPGRCTSYSKALQAYIKEASNDLETVNLKSDLREEIQAQETEALLRQRTRMLLQALGILDIEKQIEYRPPLKQLPFWKRPSVPQLQLKALSPEGIPIFTPLRCVACSNTISSSLFQKNYPEDLGTRSSEYICENCYRSEFLGSSRYTKIYKHCILDEAITSRISRSLCPCDNIAQQCNSDGRVLPLFPMKKSDKHVKATGPGKVECGLFAVGKLTAEAKFDGLRLGRSKKREQKPTPDAKGATKTTADEKIKKGPLRRPRTFAEESRHAPDREATKGDAVAAIEADATDDIPRFLKQYTERYPFGNVHMSLRIGPIAIENGVEHSQGGALITLRDSLSLFPRPIAHAPRSLALSDDPVRQLWSQNRPHGRPKRFKAIMKQVVGSPFTGLLDNALEARIIDDLIAASKQPFDDPGLSRQERSQWVKRLLQPVINHMKALISIPLSVYLESITSRLLRPDTTLKWSLTSNNCQNFCDALIDHTMFGPLVKPDLYLMSFVCRPTGYVKPIVRSKHDVPRGLTEEYLLRFRFGRHDEVDIIDSLQEYWYDWGAFGKTLYQYQDLFPWDCTEAFGRYPTRCGECNLAKHVWAFPFDSWSIIALHLARDRWEYQPATGEVSLDDAEWMRNRLLVLSGQAKLIRAAVAMARNPRFKEHTAWLHEQHDAVIDRLKLGGIHRAQPFSHVYDHQGQYKHYFIASWAALTPEERIAEYEALRDGRVRLPDVEYAQKLYDGASIDDIRQDADGGDDGPDVGYAMMYIDFNENGDGEGGAANCGTGCGSSDPDAAVAADGGNDGDTGGGDDGGGCGGCGGCADD